MRRWLTPPFAALVMLPLLVLGSPAAPAAQDTSKATATITLRYTTPASGTQAPTVVLESLGPAPAAATTLVDEEGRTAVQAVVQDLSEPTCRTAPVRDTGLGDDAQLRRHSDVDKLPEWVEEAKDYLTYAQMRSLVGWMRERGKQRATRARASLAAAEKDIGTDILPGCPRGTMLGPRPRA